MITKQGQHVGLAEITLSKEAGLGSMALKGLMLANQHKGITLGAIGAGAGLWKGLRGQRQKAPDRLQHQVNLVDPNRQFTSAPNVYGMRTHTPLVQSMNQVRADQHRQAMMNKSGSFLRDMMQKIVPYQPHTPGAHISPAQRAMQGDRKSHGYNRGQHGSFVNNMMTAAQKRRAGKENFATAQRIALQNDRESDRLHEAEVSNWAARGRPGIAPRRKSPERLMGQFNAHLGR